MKQKDLNLVTVGFKVTFLFAEMLPILDHSMEVLV